MTIGIITLWCFSLLISRVAQVVMTRLYVSFNVEMPSFEGFWFYNYSHLVFVFIFTCKTQLHLPCIKWQ